MSLLDVNINDLIIFSEELTNLINDYKKRLDVLTTALDVINSEIEGRKC